MLVVACTVQAESDRDRFSDQIASFLEVAAARHISPPPVTELLEAGIEHLAEEIDPSLAAWTEALPGADVADLLKRLHDSARPHAEPREITNTMAIGIGARLPGGVRPVSEEQAVIDDSLEGNRYVGVGVILDFREGRPVITGTYFGGPAHRAGIQAGDIVYEVEGVDTEGMGVARFIDYSRDEEGTEFTYVVAQPGARERRAVRLTRGVVPRETVVGVERGNDERWIFGPRSTPVAYVRLTGITASTAHELRKAAERIRQEGREGLVLDLRGCHSNLIQATALVADLFVTDGLLGASATRARRREYSASPDALFQADRTVVLVDSSVGGTPEWLAAALRRAGAVLAGERTAGTPLLMERVAIPGWPNEVRMATGWMLAADSEDPLAALEADYALAAEGAQAIEQARELLDR
jgi:hypothetical protein